MPHCETCTCVEPPDPVKVVRRIAEEYGLTMYDMTGRSRRLDIVDARRTVATILRGRGFLLKEIGAVLNRDHSTVSNLLRRIA